MQERLLKPIRVSFVATYFPRQCGIGTFTHDLARAVSELQGESLGKSDMVQVVAVNNVPQGYNYGQEVRFELHDQRKMDYQEAADFLNLSQTDVVCLQHEFGIFGGDEGGYILNLLSNLKKPVVTTLHTVLKEPTQVQLEMLRGVCLYSTLVVVQAQKALELLVDVYGISPEKILMIHHGAPDVPFLDPAYYKDQFQAEGRRVILTFGFINPKKGIEVAIEAMASVVQEFPDVLYIVLGATHPEVKRRFGEEYRVFLERLVKRKGLEQHVIFHNRFVSLEQLIRFLVAADIYLTPYLSKEQIVSGTLAYAIACGKAIISTPYWYAEELLANERGYLVPFRDADALANKLCQLLSNETERNLLRKRAYQFGRQMVWREVAGGYTEVFHRALEEYGSLDVRFRIRQRAIPRPSLPEINLRHLRLLTDETGILQHATFTTPDRSHGYCTDDNARALIVAILNWKLFKDESILPLLYIYLSFVHYALDESSGHVRNFMSYDRHWLEEVGSEDSHGRTLWALGMTVAHPPTDSILGIATRMFEQAMRACRSLTSPRAWAYSILGCLAYLQRFSGDREARYVGRLLSQRLLEMFKVNGSADWPWSENIVTYDNARLPQALIAAGQWLKDEGMRDQGLYSLEWLLQIQEDPQEGHLSLIGTHGWFPRGGEKARFDQQPIEVAALIDACYEAYLATQDKEWRQVIDQCLNWFLGGNDIREPVYDFRTGGCKDGLHSAGVNQNQGAESTLAWLMALHRVHEIAQEGILTKE